VPANPAGYLSNAGLWPANGDPFSDLHLMPA
jgi:hypothetical protein